MRWRDRLGAVVGVLGLGSACGGTSGDAETADSGSSESEAGSSPTGASTPGDSTAADTSGASTTPSTDGSDDDTSATIDGTTGEPSCDDLPAAITAEGMQQHLAALDQIAADNGGNRSVGTPGYDASADYVRSQLEAAGYTVTPQLFEVNVFSIVGPSTLTWQGEATFTEDQDYQVAIYSAAGSPTATARAVDVDLGLGNASTSGCEAGDFAGFPAGAIAVIQRGTCFISQKVTNAQAAGAVGAIIFNQGNDESRMGVWVATLGAQTNVTIPVVMSTYAIGEDIAQAPNGSVTIAMEVDVSLEVRETANVIVETEGGEPDDVIMLGAHLDGAQAGPGINDNGSGSAALLEVARAIQLCPTDRKLRFAWWGAEEAGLVGSQVYVDSLDAMERAAIRLYMNFDMIGSPNGVRFRYDGDGSAFGTVGPMGSAELEQVFADWFDGMGLETVETPFDGRSDYGPFVAAGIAAGGLATGAEGIKTDEQAAAHGGVAGEPYDACYHGACDDLNNIDFEILEAMGKATAHAVQLYVLP